MYNAARYDWASAERASAQKAAARWKAMPDEQLWALVTARSCRAASTSNVWHQQDGALPEVQGGSSPSATIPGDATSSATLEDHLSEPKVPGRLSRQ